MCQGGIRNTPKGSHTQRMASPPHPSTRSQVALAGNCCRMRLDAWRLRETSQAGMSQHNSGERARPDPCQHQSTGSGQIPERLPLPLLCPERGSDWDTGNCCTQSCPTNLVRADENTRTLPLPLAINWGTFYPREVLAHQHLWGRTFLFSSLPTSPSCQPVSLWLLCFG